MTVERKWEVEYEGESQQVSVMAVTGARLIRIMDREIEHDLEETIVHKTTTYLAVPEMAGLDVLQEIRAAIDHATAANAR